MSAVQKWWHFRSDFKRTVEHVE